MQTGGGIKGLRLGMPLCPLWGSTAGDPSVPAPGIPLGIFLLGIFSRRAPTWLYRRSPAPGKLRHGDGRSP